MSVTIIVGDVHLGKGLSIGKAAVGSALNSRIADQIKLLDWVLDQALEHNADTLILTGDIYEDPKPDYILVNIFINFLKQCEVHGLEVHVIAGNHDIRRTGSHYLSILDLISTSELPNIHIHKTINTIYKDGVCFTLLPFRDRRGFDCESNTEALTILAERLPYELADIPTSYDRVLVGHLALEGSLFVGDEIDDYANELMCPPEMFHGYDYVWMGHVHKPQVRSREPYVAHIGSLDISDFGETDHTKIIVVYNPDLPDKFFEVSVPSRPLRRIQLTIPPQFETTEYIVEQIQVMHEAASFKDAIVKVEIKLSGAEAKNANRELITQFITDLGAQHICNFSESRSISVVPLNKQSMDNSIKPKQAIKLWAEQMKLEEEDKKKYINAASTVLDKFYNSR